MYREVGKLLGQAFGPVALVAGQVSCGQGAVVVGSIIGYQLRQPTTVETVTMACRNIVQGLGHRRAAKALPCHWGSAVDHEGGAKAL